MKYLLFLSFLFVGSVHAEARTFLGGGTFKSQQNKENVRWTLGDWLTQKKSFRAMDQWLALNRQANLFEFNLEGGQSNYEFEIDGNVSDQKISRYSAQIWISIFGLQYTSESSDEDWDAESGQLNIRVFGQSTQTTNLTLHYGVRQVEYFDPPNEYNNQYGGASLNLYLVSFLGIEGTYRRYLAAKDDNDVDVEGERTEYGAFIDVSFVRLYGNAFIDKTYRTTAGQTDIESREGVEAGIKFYY